MINKTQEYANDTGTNWMPSIEVISKINLAIGNLSRRGVLVIADSVANQRERLSKNLEEIKKFKEDLDKEFEIYSKYIGPGEKEYYESTIANYKEYIKRYF